MNVINNTQKEQKIQNLKNKLNYYKINPKMKMKKEMINKFKNNKAKQNLVKKNIKNGLEIKIEYSKYNNNVQKLLLNDKKGQKIFIPKNRSNESLKTIGNSINLKQNQEISLNSPVYKTSNLLKKIKLNKIHKENKSSLGTSNNIFDSKDKIDKNISNEIRTKIYNEALGENIILSDNFSQTKKINQNKNKIFFKN